MALPAYPAIPYAPMVDSWGKPDLYLDPLETDMNFGNKRLRAQPGNGVQHIVFDRLFTKAQYNTFETFVQTTLTYGTSRFTMTVWMGTAFSSRTVQFAKKPVPQPNEPYVSVKFDLWVFP